MLRFFFNKATYFFLSDPPSTLLSRYLSNSSSFFTASDDTLGEFGKQTNITLMLSRLPLYKQVSTISLQTFSRSSVTSSLDLYKITELFISHDIPNTITCKNNELIIFLQIFQYHGLQAL